MRDEIIGRFLELPEEEKRMVDDLITPELAKVLVKILPEIADELVQIAQINMDGQGNLQGGPSPMPNQTPSPAPMGAPTGGLGGLGSM